MSKYKPKQVIKQAENRINGKAKKKTKRNYVNTDPTFRVKTDGTSVGPKEHLKNKAQLVVTRRKWYTEWENFYLQYLVDDKASDFLR